MKCPKCKKIDKIDVIDSIKNVSRRLDTIYLDIEIICTRCNITIHGYNFVDNAIVNSGISWSEWRK